LRATIVGSSRREGSACSQQASLLLTASDRDLQVPLKDVANQDFAIIDFSPDKQYLLMSVELRDPVKASEELTNQQLVFVQIADGKTTTWSIWEILGWKECDATVEVQGFLPDGRSVIRARPSIWSGHPHPNCLAQPTLYSFSPATNASEKLSNTTRVIRYGQELHTATQSCKSDPDLADQCFTVHGRLDLYNGGPSTRIWVIGTHHMLGVDDEIVPESVSAKLDWETDVYGDFLVCPFARRKTGHMQPICIESAKNLRTSPRK